MEMGAEMTTVRRSICIAFVIGVLAPIEAATQSTPPSSKLTDQQLAGLVVFKSNCTLCHTVGRPAPRRTSLIEAFRSGRLKEDAAQEIILGGLPQRMPGFERTLASQDVENLIAYLKSL